MILKRIRRDDTGSIPLALLITFIGVGLSTVLATVVLTQLGATRQSVGRVQALSAAQAGIDVALARLQAATSGSDLEDNPVGDVAKLPCGKITGRVGGAGSAEYTVEILYLKTDPNGRKPQQDPVWFEDSDNKIACVGGRPAEVPAYAMIEGQGFDLAGRSATTFEQRSLTGTHTFKTSNENLPGGLIHVYQLPNTLDLCLDAGSDKPHAGDPVKMQECKRARAAQTFAYTEDLNLVLVSSKLADPAGLGMCVDAGATNKAGDAVKFQPCTAPPKPAQQWSLNDSANLQGTTNGTSLNGQCLNVANPNTRGSLLVLGSCGGSYGNVRHFSMEATVGAGKATSANPPRLVNYNQFARCVDQTKHDVNYAYLIVWPCKQSPDGSVSWNQQWKLTKFGENPDRWSINTKPGSTYCLRSPLSTARGQYVRVVACNPEKPDAASTWRVSGATDRYSTSYTIVDNSGYCLSPTDPAAEQADLHFEGDNVSKLVVARCDGSTLQKWNAPANLTAPNALKDLAEN